MIPPGVIERVRRAIVFVVHENGAAPCLEPVFRVDGYPQWVVAFGRSGTETMYSIRAPGCHQVTDRRDLALQSRHGHAFHSDVGERRAQVAKVGRNLSPLAIFQPDIETL